MLSSKSALNFKTVLEKYYNYLLSVTKAHLQFIPSRAIPEVPLLCAVLCNVKCNEA